MVANTTDAEDTNAEDALNDADGKSVFTFNLNIYVDTDTALDTGRGVLPSPNTANIPADQVGPESPTNRVNDLIDDRDEINTIPITVRILKVDGDEDEDEIAFATVPRMRPLAMLSRTSWA